MMFNPEDRIWASPYGSHVLMGYTKEGHPVAVFVNEIKGQVPNINEDGVTIVLGSMLESSGIQYPNISKYQSEINDGLSNYLLMMTDDVRYVAKKNMMLYTFSGNMMFFSGKKMIVESIDDMIYSTKKNILFDIENNMIAYCKKNMELYVDNLFSVISQKDVQFLSPNININALSSLSFNSPNISFFSLTPNNVLSDDDNNNNENVYGYGMLNGNFMMNVIKYIIKSVTAEIQSKVVQIVAEELNLITGKDILINGDNSVIIKSNNIQIGNGKNLQGLLKESFKYIYDSHYHTVGNMITSMPINQTEDDNITKILKAE